MKTVPVNAAPSHSSVPSSSGERSKYDSLRRKNMINKAVGLASALTVALAMSWAAGQQPETPTQDQKEGPARGPADRRGRGEGFGGGARARGGPAGPFRPGAGLEQALANFNLSEKKKEQADTAIKAYQENVRKLMDLARAELLLKMTESLSEQEVKQFKENLDRAPAPVNARGRRGPGNRGLSVDEIVERILSFDKNKDGKVSKEELPERMQDLITKGDTNKDGALDKEEIKNLATELAREGRFGGFFGAPGPGGGFAGGFRGRGPAGPFPPGNVAERALSDLRLTDKQKEAAETAVKTHQDTVRKLTELARADLLLKMKEVLSEDEWKRFQAVVDREPRFVPRGNGRNAPFASPAAPSDSARSGDLERRLDQLQRSLDELRREIRR
jgi:hypothetical protein